MAILHSISGLSEIASDYDVLLCDVWGVVHNGERAYAEGCAALGRFRTERGPVVLISNAPRPASAVVAQFEQIGVPQTAWSTLVTSGDTTRAALRERGRGPALAIGPARDAPLYDGLELGFTDAVDEAAFVVCTGLIDDETETADDYRERLARAAVCGLEFICANPDRVVQRGYKMIPCAGALADLYGELGGKVVMLGKPYAPIYDLALGEAGRLLGRAPERARVLCIGDGLATDVTGAQAQSLDCLFVGAGIHGTETLTPSGALDVEGARAFLSRHKLESRYGIAELAW